MTRKASQSNIQVELLPAPATVETATVSDVTAAFNERVHTVTETATVSDTAEAVNNTSHASSIDSPYTEPIRILQMDIPGLPLYLCDRTWGAGVNFCVYDGQLYEPLILSWDSIELGSIDPVTYKTDPGRASVILHNDIPVGGFNNFTDLFSVYNPHFVTVTISEFFIDVKGNNTDSRRLFKGAIEDPHSMSTSQITLAFTDNILNITNKFTHEIIDATTYPNADEDDVGNMLPQTYGQVKKLPFMGINVSALSTLSADIDNAVQTFPISDSSKFPSSGTVQINSEQMTYTGNASNTLTGGTRSVSGEAAAHSSGAAVYVVGSPCFYAIGHPLHSISDVFVWNNTLQENVRQTGNYTAYTGQLGGKNPTYQSMAVIEFTSRPSPLGGRVSADVSGWRDNSLGTYTGYGSTLIEQPNHIAKHILINRCGLTDREIDADTYAATNSLLSGESFAQAVAILEKPNVRELLNDIAHNAKSIEFWEAGTHHFVFIPEIDVVDKTLDASRIDQDQTSVKYTDRVNIINTFSARYKKDWAGFTNAEDALRAVIIVSGEFSVADYGKLENKPIDLPYLTGSGEATTVIEWIRDNLDYPRLNIELTGGYYFTDIKRGQIVNFNFNSGELDIPGGDDLNRALLRLVKPTDRFRVIDMARTPDAAITIDLIGEKYVFTPVITPSSGDFIGAHDVTMTCPTEDASIYYTTDGSDPDKTSSRYFGAVSIAVDQTSVKAKAYKTGIKPSAIAGASYTGGLDGYVKLLLQMEDLTLTDGSASAHTTILTGNVCRSDLLRKFGDGGAYFDGVNDYLSIPAHNDWDLSGGGTGSDFTIDFWFRTSNIASSTIIGTWISSTGWKILTVTGDNTQWWCYYGSNNYTVTTPAYDDDTWHHFAWVRESAVDTFYFDGTAVSKTGSVGNQDGNGVLYLGVDNGQDQDYKGWLDEVRVSNIARWSTNFSAPTSAYTSDANTKLLLHMDDAGLTDSGNTGHTVTKNGNAMRSLFTKQLGTYSAHFDGDGDYIGIADSADFNFGSGGFTIDFWFRFDNVTSWQWLMSQGTSPWWGIAFDNVDGEIQLFSLANSNIVTGASTVLINTWYHLAITDDTTTVRLFLDGILKASDSSIAVSDAAGNLYLGTNSTSVGTQNFFGYIDELRISKGIARWTSNFTPPTSPYA